MTKGIISASILIGGLLAMSSASRAGEITARTQQLLQSSDYIYVATQRSDGQFGSFAPIWFMYDQGKIFFTTEPKSHKAKRIAKGSPLAIRVGSEDGPALTGKAEKVTDPALVERMGEAYNKKYWIAWLGLFRPRAERVTEGKTAAFLVDIEEPQ
jgi:general stress protein 26